MGSILGSKQSSTQNSSSTGSGTSQSVNVSNSNQQSQSSSKAGMTADQVLGTSADMTKGWTKEAALSDVNGAIKNQALTALQGAMPSIAKQTNSAGAYNSTTRDLLTNDATARIVGQLAETQLGAITSYGQLSNQNLGAVSGVSSATGSSNSSSTGTSSSAGLSTSEYDQSSTGSGGSKGGSGLLGLFADGGEVAKEPDGDEGNSALNTFLDLSGINGAIKEVKDTYEKANQLATNPQQFMRDYMENIKKDMRQSANPVNELRKVGGGLKDEVSNLGASGEDKMAIRDVGRLINAFANGGRVPRYADGGMIGGGDLMSMMDMPDIAALLADGGVVPGGKKGDSVKELLNEYLTRGQAVPKNTLTPETELLAAIQKYKNGGAVRSGETDVQAGGKIRGKQSPTGEDNQVIGVAGGEGIIPKDVMDVAGVPEMLRTLIQKYHTPVQATK